MKKNLLLFIFLGYSCIISCSTQTRVGNLSFVPKVIHPTYLAYSVNNERGYDVKFELTMDQPQPTAIIFNHIKKTIFPTEQRKKSYHINVITQTDLLSDYAIEKSDLPNGLLYKIDDKFYFQKVEFKKGD